MFPFAVALILFFYAEEFADAIATAEETNLALQREFHTLAVERVSDATETFFEVNGTYPTDYSQLGSTPGTEWVSTYDRGPEGRLRYARATDINGSGVRFERSAVFYLDPIRYTEDAAAYLSAPANNVCGGAPFDTADEWCAPPQDYWWRGESRTLLIERQALVRRSLNVTIYKFLARFTHDGTLPKQTDANSARTVQHSTTLAAGDTYALRDLVMRLGTSVIGTDSFGCRGRFVFENVALDCGDLYAPGSGAPVLYTFNDDQNIVFSVSSGVQNNAGMTVMIAQELIL